MMQAFGGQSGSVSISGGVSTIDGTINLSGAQQRKGGNVTVSGAANVTMTGTTNLKGGDGESPPAFGDGEDGGNGGDLLITGGGFTLNDLSATVDLQPGAGGSASGPFSPGSPGAPGSVDVSGGTLTLNEGLIRGAIGTPSADPINLFGADIIITSTGVVNVNNNMTIDNGTLSRDATGNFNLGSGLTLTATNDAQLDFDGDYELNDGTTFDLQSGADLVSSGLHIAALGSGDGTLLVDGAGTSVMTDNSGHLWGTSGDTANVTFRNSATGSVGAIELAFGSTAGTTGIFNVESGAMVTTNNLQVATDGGTTTTGTINVDGAGSSLTQDGASHLTLGINFGTPTATVNVTGDGTFNTGTGSISLFPTGTINIGTGMTGGTLNANGDMTILGTVNLFDGQMNAGMVSLVGSGAFNFTGGTLTVDNFVGDLAQDGGTLVIGSSPGITTVTGAYDLNAGALEIELFGGGVSPVAGVDFDQLTADTANLGGTLDLVADAGYTPTLGDLFSIISTTSGVSGTFDAVSGAYLGGGLGLTVNYSANNVTLEAISVLLGDFDVDGDVDGFDFLFWQLDPSVGSLADWKANYGMIATLSASSAAVPEPTTCTLALAALCLAMGRRRC
jgi:hypothetical protein